MSLNLDGSARLNEFYETIEPWAAAYTNSSFSFVAVRTSDDWHVVQGSLSLNTLPPANGARSFRTDNVLAGTFLLSEVDTDFKTFVASVLSGAFSTPYGPLLYPHAGEGHSIVYTPVHPSAQQNQSRLNVVRLGGANHTFQHRQEVLDWEVRGADIPYDSLTELALDYGQGGFFSDVVSIEIIATSIIGFGEKSGIAETSAEVELRFAKDLSSTNVSMGYRVFSHGKVIERAILNESDFRWESSGAVQIGRAVFQVPPASVVQCYANYLGKAHCFWWLADPKTAQSSRRTVYETFDDQLIVLKEFLGRTNVRGRNARDLERAVAWLLWMLGFSIAHLGEAAGTQDAADIVVESPSGHFGVVECTTGLLRTDNKLPLLIARTEAVRRRLKAANLTHFKVLPIMVTSRSLEDVKADLEQAQKLGVLVVTQETLEQAITRTLITGDANTLFSDAERVIAEGVARHAPKVTS